MGNETRRATIYFESELYRTLKVKAACTNRTVSDLVNDAVRLALAEDQDDLAKAEARSGEASVSYEAMLKDLKTRGKL